MECAKYIDRNVQGKSVDSAKKQNVCEEDWGGGDVVVQSALNTRVWFCLRTPAPPA